MKKTWRDWKAGLWTFRKKRQSHGREIDHWLEAERIIRARQINMYAVDLMVAMKRHEEIQKLAYELFEKKRQVSRQGNRSLAWSRAYYRGPADGQAGSLVSSITKTCYTEAWLKHEFHMLSSLYCHHADSVLLVLHITADVVKINMAVHICFIRKTEFRRSHLVVSDPDDDINRTVRKTGAPLYLLLTGRCLLTCLFQHGCDMSLSISASLSQGSGLFSWNNTGLSPMRFGCHREYCREWPCWYKILFYPYIPEDVRRPLFIGCLKSLCHIEQ